MTEPPFATLLDLYGADLAGWPAADAARARRMLRDDPAALALWQAEYAFEQALRHPGPAIAPDRAERVCADALSRLAPAARWRALLPEAQAAGLALMLGVALVLAVPGTETRSGLAELLVWMPW